MGNICQFCHKRCNGQVLLQCKHPICSKCVQTQFSFEQLRAPCDQFPLNTEHKQKEGKQQIHDEKKTINICCPKCKEKTILIFSQGNIKLSNNQQQQQQYIPDDLLKWVFQFLNAKELFTKIRFTSKRVDKIVCTSLHSLHCQGMCVNGLKFAPKVLPMETQLQELNLMANNIDDNEATKIASVFPLIQQLQILDLSWNKIGNTGAVAIANSVSHLKQLQVLDISCNPIEGSGITVISNATKELTKLQHLGIYEEFSHICFLYMNVLQMFNEKRTELDLSNCNIDDVCAISVAKMLPHLTQLQVLYLGVNQIGDTGATALANSISNLTQLQRLYLDYNQIGDIGAIALANSINNLTQLQVLNLNRNRIGYTGATALASSITNLTQLQELDLGDNLIGDTGAIAIGNSITNLTKLQVFRLSNNQIEDTGTTVIANSIKRLTRLNCLSLYNNNISEPVKQQLKEQFGDKLCIYNFNH